MQLKMFSVRDDLMAIYLAPFFARNEVEAKRQIDAALRDPQMGNTPMVMSPKDFSLWRVGTFDDDTGQVQSNHECILRSLASAEAPGTVST